METLLSPERLRQLGYDSREAIQAIKAIALGPEGSADRSHLEQHWEERACAEELAFLDLPPDGQRPLPSTLPACARGISRRLQTEVLRTELKRLAHAIGVEGVRSAPCRRGA